MTTHAEAIGQAADRIDNLLGALQLPLPPAMHIQQLRMALPEIRNTLRLIHIEQTGDDPWEAIDRSHWDKGPGEAA